MTSLPVVLDTNVCLDLFVFRDARCHALAQILERREVKAVTRNDCREEWLRVLAYPVFSLNESVRQKYVAEYDSFFSFHDSGIKSHATLPVCKDPDDQKFLELAQTARAKFIVTKDKALLRLSAKTSKIHEFQIIKPENSHLITALIKSYQ